MDAQSTASTIESTTLARPRVYVAQEPGRFDVARAASLFGDVVFLSTHEIVAFGSLALNAATVAAIYKIMERYTPGVDFLLPVGGPLAQAHMFAAAFKKPAPRHRILKWDSRGGHYDIYEMVIP